jgi:hypothetical protein
LVGVIALSLPPRIENSPPYVSAMQPARLGQVQDRIDFARRQGVGQGLVIETPSWKLRYSPIAEPHTVCGKPAEPASQRRCW